ncbi:RNA polymerase I specific transcription initiation factor RRN3 [Lasiodiplodia theobromae]|uniref:RNA polymerase I-specific transcription initiation factor rrn3 n=1 Tax=Lasiodiplodia theobromae TaxID=45133 RepID=A0A5N5D103_9PEZI|nr:RNA polymerase i-specific transcription initiation factor rrn3 family protein [Lasiodiplodia theobromae]KAB2571345.1 RNA polymerase I-specific transcription initiation factor rrn3 [Lasiodiplodia theobromae]KAF4538356.1 RNA polymerase i-specific transcription initiation factor rrn3 family protein [Lasiodiplodia theobromae]KAF9633442.1 RNA polymerase I specific transcription initiation factor RRN3 [Lasiodiplodia theobromae]
MVSLAAPVAALPSSNAKAAIPGPSLKRKHMDSDSDTEAPAVARSKKPRVSFDPTVDIRLLEDFDEKGIELVREEVRRAIDKHVAGDSASYDEIKTLFTTRPTASAAPSTKLLGKYVVALIGNVSLLNKNCSGLVHAILDCQWLARDEAFKRLYVTLLASLMSAHGGYTGQVLQSLVKYFHGVPSPNLRHERDPPITRSELRQRVHETLKRLLKLIPSASGVLTSLLQSSFPSTQETAKVYLTYLNNLMELMEYAPELKGLALALITENLVKLDVQIQVDMEDLEEEFEEAIVQEALYKREEIDEEEDDTDAGDEDEEDSDDDSSSDDGLDSDQRRIQELKDSVGKMDSILDILFEYYHRIFVTGTHVDALETFEFLLAQFKNIILPTYRSRHTQFLLFHFAQSSPLFADKFTYVCAELAFDKTRPQIMRLAAAAYLASFIARGAHVPRHAVQAVFQVLGQQLDDFRLRNEGNCKGPDLRRYTGYYSLAQALLYIFCFRWRDLIVSETDSYADDEEILFQGGDLAWLPGMKEMMMRNIYSKFNPLKVCSPGVVTQFARIAHHLRFLYVFPLLETNKRLKLSRFVSAGAMYGMQERETALSAKNNESAFQLDSYFPFDPYSLPRSKRWMEGDYNEWKSIPGLDQEEADDYSDSDSQADESDDEETFEDGTATEAST